jgi:DNA-binding NtrC family response regulator
MGDGKTQVFRVLVVDDESLIRWSIAETLRDLGHAVVEAGDAASTVRALTSPEAPIDAVILDYRLPDSDDLGLLESVRRLSPASAVIMMTAYGTPEVTGGALDRGVYRVMSKPFEMDDLVTALGEACAARR